MAKGYEETLKGMRAYLSTDSGLSTAGIYLLTVPLQAALPCTTISMAPVRPLRTLGGTAWWQYRLSVKHLAQRTDTLPSTMEQMKPLKDAVTDLLLASNAQADLNAILSGLGFRSGQILDDGDIEYGEETIGDDLEEVRGFMGGMYQLRISPL